MHSQVGVLPGQVLIDPGLLLEFRWVPVIGHAGRMLLRHVLEDGDAAEIQKETLEVDNTANPIKAACASVTANVHLLMLKKKKKKKKNIETHCNNEIKFTLPTIRSEQSLHPSAQAPFAAC